ncbi:polyprenyl synthetase family protein [Corynebacterium sp. zg-331]|uniref:polyprenyl synthetase family protein n=1 Tax=unclassified Corynebacterium TaxID=2624378 RepID=UPI00128CBAF7|nr:MULTISPECIES: polyprenyl synthetase family protein [unclassified Corynebacterium]MBC3186077.1 polyprenyl synthetase family protein [Corynebacterium sp. zg-331]MPV52567.1 polyprenyl synthetase family protein [Corynebacterium sp. zg331]
MTKGREAATPGVVAGSLNLGDEALNERVGRGLNLVEETLYEHLSRSDDILRDKVMHLVNAGGKRFRPMFALLASEYGERPMSEDVIRAAAVVEMTHLATLYHDDVMDEAARRRGVESANARWGNSVAILAGDHLLAQASGIMAQLGTDTVTHFAETFGTLVTGQMRETVGAQGGDPIAHYTRVIEEKTGVLIASAGYLGALHSGAKEEYVAALRGYGHAIGMVFQIVDDIIDLFSTPEESGKVRGTDLREGVFTLPVLYALGERGSVGDRLREILTGPVTSEEELSEALGLLERSEGRARAAADVAVWAQRAREYLAVLPQGPATRALEALVVYTAERLG